MSQQLVKKGANGKHENVMPKSWIEAIKDKNTGQTLVDILQGFNMYFLPYNGNTSSTRCLVPTMLRKKGLWITYVKYDNTVYTEWYAADGIDDKSWGDSSNWRIGNNTLVGDITISANGNWVIKGVDTKFRWLATSGDTQANNVGRIQASTDEGKTWTSMSNDFINNLHIKKYIGVNESLPTSGIAEGTIYAKGPYYAEEDTLNDNPIYRLWVYAWKGDTLAWQDNGEFTSIAAGVVQETGDSETKIMSQKTVTSNLVNVIIGKDIEKSASIIYGGYNVNTGFVAGEQVNYYPATEAILLEEGKSRQLNAKDANAFMYYTVPPNNAEAPLEGTFLGWDQNGQVPDNAKYVIIGYPQNYPIIKGEIIRYGYKNTILKNVNSNTQSILNINNQINNQKVVIQYGAYNTNSGKLFGEQAVQYLGSRGIEIDGFDYIKMLNDYANVYLFYSGEPQKDGSNYLGYNQTGSVIYGAKYVVLGLGKESPLSKGDYIEYYTNKEINGRVNILEDKINNITIKKLVGKTVWTLWDSLGHDTWQGKFVNLSGCTYYSALNTKGDKPLSWGGSNSEPSNDSGTQARALNLLSYKDTYPIDIVLIENINDRNILNRKGSINDVPFMRTQVVTYSNNIFNSYTEANNYLNSNKLSIINSIPEEQRKRGTIIKIPYTSGSEIRGSKIKFNSTPISEGDITLTWAGKAYSIHVTPSMSIQDIVDSVIQYSFGAGVSDIDNGDGSVSIFYYTSTTNRVTFDGGTTGVTATVTDTSGSGTIALLFKSDNINNWSNVDEWSTDCSLYSIYKGLIEYLKSNIPTALLYFVQPFSVGIDFNSNEFKYADGTWSADKFRKSSTYLTQKELYDVQKEVAEYYGVQVLDLVATGGMDITNIETYFYSGNVHPKTIGYDRYAEAMYNLM